MHDGASAPPIVSYTGNDMTDRDGITVDVPTWASNAPCKDLEETGLAPALMEHERARMEARMSQTPISLIDAGLIGHGTELISIDTTSVIEGCNGLELRNRYT